MQDLADQVHQIRMVTPAITAEGKDIELSIVPKDLYVCFAVNVVILQIGVITQSTDVLDAKSMDTQ